MRVPGSFAPRLGVDPAGDLRGGEDSKRLTPEEMQVLASRSTEREAQKRKLSLVVGMRPHHTYELRRMGISHPAGRIQDLEADGYVISVDRITVVDENGFAHPRVALYGLVSAPGAKEDTA